MHTALSVPPSTDPSSYSIYSLDSTISDFFAQTNTTRADCDQLAADLLGTEITDIAPPPLQGCLSYSVAAPSSEFVIQFRRRHHQATSKASQAALALVPAIHPSTTPLKCHITTLSGGDLIVSKIARVRGTTLLEVSPTPDAVRAAAVGMARFFANALARPQPPPVDAEELLASYRTDLALLIAELPAKYTASVTVPTTADKVKWVLTHGDLQPLNIFVDGTAGLSAVVDWEHASLAPAGLEVLVGLKNVLGYMGPGGWMWHKGWDEAIAAFWEKLGLEETQRSELVEWGKFGLLQRHGFTTRGKERKVTRSIDLGCWEYMEAFLAAKGELWMGQRE